MGVKSTRSVTLMCMRICSKADCMHEGRPQGDANFYKDKQKKSGYRPDCKDCVNRTVKTYVESLDPAQRKAQRDKAQRKYTYGLSQPDFDVLVDRADDRCESCGDPTIVMHIDHDHATGKVRGLLCQDCNLGIGRFRDSPERLRQAAAYLERVG